ncbi:hypothetical protein [Nitrosopumilus sp.]|uniref:hypothetical protein n=1 Tax=Nitrosopumilus sp. TaxID=2024843 RepID=UPI00247D21BF|nr:hypothetical protein [Nitrosopumilus sp.]MCV0409639.1 hypothetical protein [Nitrosopumilus sp.]
MKTRFKIPSCKTNILFILNAVLVGILSIGASYFTLVPLVMFDRNISDIVRMSTQNYAMIGLWIIYFANIICLPINLKKTHTNWKLGYILFLIGIMIFVIYITGVFDCWEAMVSKFFGMDYNDRIRCLNEN